MPSLFEDLWRDVRYAARALRRAPGHSSAIVILLSLGIGANTAMFSLVNAIYLRDLPVAAPERLVLIDPGFSTPAYEDFRRIQTSFTGTLATGSITFTAAATSAGGEQIPNVRGGIASGNYFQVLGVEASLGRVFTEADDKVGDPQPVVVLSEAFWRRQFDRDPNVLGRQLYLYGAPFTIVGVTPRGFAGEMPGRVRDFWVPLNMQPVANPEGDRRRDRSFPWLVVIGRLKEGVGLVQARAEAEVLYDTITGVAPAQPRRGPSTVRVESAVRGLAGFRRQFGTPLQILAVTVAIVLLIVCASVATLLLARGTGRQHEIAIRQALGCSRSRLMRHLFLEGLLLALAGGLIGLMLAPASAQALMSMHPTSSPAVLDFSLDTNMLLFGLGASLLTAIAFSIAPALSASRVAIEPALKSASRSGTGSPSRQRIIRWVMVFQTALSVILVAASFLFAKSLARLHVVETGFDRPHIISATINARLAGYDDLEQAMLGKHLTERISAIPGVKSASVALCAVMMGCSRASRVDMEGQLSQPDDPRIWINPVSANYFETAGIPLLAGRGFGQQDRPGSPPVAVVTEALARFYFPGQSALGKRFTERSGAGRQAGAIEIIGVVRDVRFVSPRDAPIRMAFLSLEQFPGVFSYLQVRTSRLPEALIPVVRQLILQVDPKLRMRGPQAPSENLDLILSRDLLLARVSGVFGTIALILACFGMYGVISYLVAAKRTELGIRLALGAQPGQVKRQVIAGALKTVAPGIVFGIAGAFAAGTLIESLLFGVTGRDPLTYLSVAAALLLTTVLAAWLPARQASRIDPITALRSE